MYSLSMLIQLLNKFERSINLWFPYSEWIKFEKQVYEWFSIAIQEIQNSVLVTMIDFKFDDQYVYTPNPSHMYLIFCEMYWYTKNGELYFTEKNEETQKL